VEPAKPFVKWLGGKRQILPTLRQYVPPSIGTYYEPFVGGGALFFSLANDKVFRRAVLADTNPDLFAAYQAIAGGRIDAVTSLLAGYEKSREFFDLLRKQDVNELDEDARVARFLYLNRMAYNGLYRVNQKGLFNAPFGDYDDPKLFDLANLRAVANALRGVRFVQEDFEASCSRARKGDLVYFDPPYLPLSATSNFTSYSAKGFTLKDHERLAKFFKKLAARGVSVLLSNSDHEAIRALFEGFPIEVVRARRNVNNRGQGRGPINEILVRANL
jgi:DNA adenine methylase